MDNDQIYAMDKILKILAIFKTLNDRYKIMFLVNADGDKF